MAVSWQGVDGTLALVDAQRRRMQLDEEGGGESTIDIHGRRLTLAFRAAQNRI
jgi:hypothetical protein